MSILKKATLNTFWDGPSNPYMRLCVASWISHGFDVNVYATQPDLSLPAGVCCKAPEEILDLGGIVHRYKAGFGAGSPALHTNLFRLKLVAKGEWWLDADVFLQKDTLPDGDVFVCAQDEKTVGNAIMKFPGGSKLLQEGIQEVEAAIAKGDVKWAQTGPDLLTSLIKKHGMSGMIAPRRVAYEIGWTETNLFFNPSQREQVIERTATSTFVHLWHSIWRAIGFPMECGPPPGSYVDYILQKHSSSFGCFMPAECVAIWWRNWNSGGRL